MAADEEIKWCQLAAVCYQLSIHTHSSSVFNKLLNAVSGWGDKMMERKREHTAKGFSFTGQSQGKSLSQKNESSSPEVSKN